MKYRIAFHGFYLSIARREFVVISGCTIMCILTIMCIPNIVKNSVCQKELNNGYNHFAVAVPDYQFIMGVIASGKNSIGK